MIQMQTKLKIIDNSGAKIAQCIKPLGGFNRTYGYNGDILVVTIKQLRLIRKVKKSEVYFALVVRTKKSSTFKDGSLSKFNENAIILLNSKKRILGTRLFGPVSKTLRKKKYLKILIMCGNKIY